MTPKEIIEILKEELDEWLKWADADDAYWTAQKYVDAYEMAIDAIKKADKYAWHDLRKDLKDLPCILQEVIVCVLTESGNKKYFSTCYVKDGFLAGGYQVIAWREIEPFGEVQI